MESALVQLGWLWGYDNSAGGGWGIIGFEEKVSMRPGTPHRINHAFMRAEGKQSKRKPVKDRGRIIGHESSQNLNGPGRLPDLNSYSHLTSIAWPCTVGNLTN